MEIARGTRIVLIGNMKGRDRNKEIAGVVRNC